MSLRPSSLSRGRGGDSLAPSRHMPSPSSSWTRSLTPRRSPALVRSLAEWRALAFCLSIYHAESMDRRFSSAGIPALQVSARSPPAERSDALRRLRMGEVNVLFAVDLFNEGLDVPNIDTVLLLRPTESPVVFMQQIGRGLRRTEGKDGLTILDFIGQQRRKFRYSDRFQALTGQARNLLDKQVEQGFPFLPSGC